MTSRRAAGTILSFLLLAAAPALRAQDAAGDDSFDEFEEFAVRSSTPAKKVFDPLSGYNRIMFKFNDKFYFWFAKPVARGYGFVVPKPLRTSFAKGFHNFGFPLRFANAVLQLRFKKAGTELGRFVVNSTAGIGGLFDPADRYLGWHRPSPEDFGQTFARYGVGDGFPLVLPILGPTNLRDGAGMATNFLVNPLYYLADFDVNFAVGASEQFNKVSLHIGEYESIKADALDPYTFIRDAYKQNRDKNIKE